MNNLKLYLSLIPFSYSPDSWSSLLHFSTKLSKDSILVFIAAIDLLVLFSISLVHFSIRSLKTLPISFSRFCSILYWCKTVFSRYFLSLWSLPSHMTSLSSSAFSS